LLNVKKVIEKTLGAQEVISIHEDILKESGGLTGFRKDASLESALHRIDDHIGIDGLMLRSGYLLLRSCFEPARQAWV
jgi:hypothetical protein